MLGVIEERRESGNPVAAQETFVAVAEQYQILYNTNRPTIRVLEGGSCEARSHREAEAAEADVALGRPEQPRQPRLGARR
jgi:hypothetical protein